MKIGDIVYIERSSEIGTELVKYKITSIEPIRRERLETISNTQPFQPKKYKLIGEPYIYSVEIKNIVGSRIEHIRIYENYEMI